MEYCTCRKELDGVGMNVLFIASDNNYTSGAFLSMVKLNQLLASEYQINTFVVLPNEGDGDRLLEEAAIPFEIVPSRNWVVDIEEGKTEQREWEKAAELSGNESAISRIVDIINERKIDILHINTSYSYVGACAALQVGIPFVWHIREFLEEDQNRKIWNCAEGYELMRKADAVIAISDSIYQKYQKLLVPEKLCVIYNGIDEKVFYDPDKKIFQGKTIELGIIGGVVPYKGQEELIKACGILKKKGISDFRLRIIGKGKENYIDYLKKIVREENLEKNIIFTGPSNKIPDLLKEIDILLVCSRNEAFGRITVEGMMAGCVVIGADTAGTTEILEDGKCGFLYRQGDVTDLARKIENVIEIPQLAEQVRSEGQKKAMSCYTAMKNAQKVYELLESVFISES